MFLHLTLVRISSLRFSFFFFFAKWFASCFLRWIYFESSHTCAHAASDRNETDWISRMRGCFRNFNLYFAFLNVIFSLVSCRRDMKKSGKFQVLYWNYALTVYYWMESVYSLLNYDEHYRCSMEMLCSCSSFRFYSSCFMVVFFSPFFVSLLSHSAAMENTINFHLENMTE